MQIVIDISARLYEAITKEPVSDFAILGLISATKYGKPLPRHHRGIVDLKDVQWAFDDAILDDAQRTGHARATHDEISSILKTVPTIIEESENNDL